MNANFLRPQKEDVHYQNLEFFFFVFDENHKKSISKFAQTTAKVSVDNTKEERRCLAFN